MLMGLIHVLIVQYVLTTMGHILAVANLDLVEMIVQVIN